MKGEPDASSFPSGGLRATASRPGATPPGTPPPTPLSRTRYCASPPRSAAIRGEVLDEKTPLLRSMAAISTQACRILKLFGKTVPQVSTTVGPEQEYFLVDREQYLQREDLRLCGRTLFGAMPPKGQELDDHYFGVIKPRVAGYMKELDDELWKLGVAAKTKHNEVAPAQHELAPIFSTTNIAVDHNQLTMEMMKSVAARHGMACLLHEKPFDGVNGSGKHNNWSISTPTGKNLLDPGKTPMENPQFLLFLAAVIKAVDEYQDLLACPWPPRATTTVWAPTRRRRPSSPCSVGEELDAILSPSNPTRTTWPRPKRLELGVHILPTLLQGYDRPQPHLSLRLHRQ